MGSTDGVRECSRRQRGSDDCSTLAPRDDHRNSTAYSSSTDERLSMPAECSSIPTGRSGNCVGLPRRSVLKGSGTGGASRSTWWLEAGERKAIRWVSRLTVEEESATLRETVLHEWEDEKKRREAQLLQIKMAQDRQRRAERWMRNSKKISRPTAGLSPSAGRQLSVGGEGAKSATEKGKVSAVEGKTSAVAAKTPTAAAKAAAKAAKAAAAAIKWSMREGADDGDPEQSKALTETSSTVTSSLRPAPYDHDYRGVEEATCDQCEVCGSNEGCRHGRFIRETFKRSRLGDPEGDLLFKRAVINASVKTN